MEMGAEVLPSNKWSWPTVVALVWTLLAAPYLLFWILFLRKEKLQKRKYKLPPGPPTWPIVGNVGALLDTTKSTHQVIDDLTKVYGPIMLLKIGVQNIIFVSDPEMTLEFSKAQDHLFAFRPEGLAKYLLYGDSHLSKHTRPLKCF
jgi:hypothetical protein